MLPKWKLSNGPLTHLLIGNFLGLSDTSHALIICSIVKTQKARATGFFGKSN